MDWGKIFDVVVIGSGIAGLSASWSLSKGGIEHVILESRDRIGGRIATQEFAGRFVHTGASFVHCPDERNRIATLVKEWQLPTVPAGYESVQYLIQGAGEPEQKVVDEAEELVDGLMQSIQEVAAEAKQDISLEQAADRFMKGTQGSSQHVQDIIRWNLDILGNIEGAELGQISAKEFENDEHAEDFIPAEGYIKILHKILDQHQPIIKLQRRVVKIDYEAEPIKLHTENEIYFARKVISSLPLGILQKSLVQFCPPLPEAHRNAIQKMGNGVANKLIVNFEQPFWDTSKLWVNFVTRDKNKYPVALSMVGEGYGQHGQHMLCFFVSADASKQISELSDSEISEDLLTFLRGFCFKEEVIIKDIFVTRWHKDPHSLGSYSYLPVGTTTADIVTLRSPIRNKLWMAGEHTHPSMNACAHAAF